MKIIKNLAIVLLSLSFVGCGMSSNTDGGTCTQGLLDDYNEIVSLTKSTDYSEALDSVREFRSNYPEVDCVAINKSSGEEINITEKEIDKTEAILRLGAALSGN